MSCIWVLFFANEFYKGALRMSPFIFHSLSVMTCGRGAPIGQTVHSHSDVRPSFEPCPPSPLKERLCDSTLLRSISTFRPAFMPQLGLYGSIHLLPALIHIMMNWLDHLVQRSRSFKPFGPRLDLPKFVPPPVQPPPPPFFC